MAMPIVVRSINAVGTRAIMVWAITGTVIAVPGINSITESNTQGKSGTAVSSAITNAITATITLSLGFLGHQQNAR